MGYGPESEHAVIELTYNYGVEKYELGTAFGHIALEVEDAYKACDEIKKRGGKVVREARPMKHGTTVIAFVEDPDGWLSHRADSAGFASWPRTAIAAF